VSVLEVIDAPLPEAPPASLLQLQDIIPEPDERFLNGVQTDVYPCAVPDAWDPSCDPTPASKASARPPAFQEAAAFGLVLGYKCTARGLDFADFRRRLAAGFASTEHVAVEKEFWSGTLVTTNPRLASPSATTLAGTLSPREGLSALEDALTRRGVIHASVRLVNAWAERNLLVRDAQGRLFTWTGNRVVSGQGYPGTAPAGTGPVGTTEWAYATGSVQIRRTTTEVVPREDVLAVNHSNNDVVVYAERFYVITFDSCTHAAQLIDRAL
jgi:hypothetical protein